jgi:hypothetical protein
MFSARRPSQVSVRPTLESLESREVPTGPPLLGNFPTINTSVVGGFNWNFAGSNGSFSFSPPQFQATATLVVDLLFLQYAASLHV